MPKFAPLSLPREAPRDVRIVRDADGVPHISGDTLSSVLWGLGYCHALDRGLQLLASRIFAEGRVSECLVSTEETNEIDVFFRRLSWRSSAARELEGLDAQARASLVAYAAGVNARLARHSPWELRLMRYTPEAWTPADTILLSRATGYVGLAQSQGEIERLFVEMVQAGVDDARLAALFPDIPEIQALDGRDPRLPSRALLEKVRLGQRIVPDGVRWLCPVPRMTASNSWVLAPSKTRSGHAMLANDPHLEVNRLPNVWYEIVAQIRGIPGHYVMAATMPGLPAPLIGRTPALAWGATYTFMDAIDSWIEECRGGRYRREGELLPFTERKEEIRRKNAPSVYVTFHENEHGVLDGDPTADGYLLATRWASAETGARSVEATLAMWTALDVDQGMQELGRVETAWNWMLADRAGNIGYQMSGLSPKRRPGVSGFVPLVGWLPDNDWQGFEAPTDLPRAKNPACGYLVTANQDVSQYSKVRVQNATMADYRAERITQLIDQRNGLTVDDSKAIQYDTYSMQAALFMDRLRPLLPDSDQGRLLSEWDLRYERDSKGARLFEAFYAELIEIVIGRYVIGEGVVRHLSSATALFATFFKNVDPLLLDPPRAFCAGRCREELYLEAFEKAVTPRHGSPREADVLRLTHLLLGGRLPAWMGFDRGPISLPGGRATPFQSQFYRVGGRAGCLAPSVRVIADLGEDVLHTNIAGGPSDRRFSRWYCSGLEGWLNGNFRTSRAEPPT
jgi:penicillin G amidase